MSQQVTVKGLNVLDEVREQLGQKVEDAVKDRLVDMAQTVVRLSPVDTGAYVTSHSFKTSTSSRGRGKTSANKPRQQNAEAKRREGFDNLMSDISGLDLKDTSQITLRNDSPHAWDVETGHQWEKQEGYFVYAQMRNIYG